MSHVFEAIGTRWQIDAGELSPFLISKIQDRIEEFDKNYSRFRQDSLISEMARKSGVYQLPLDAEPMLAVYRELYDLTDGRMTPLVGQMLVDAGYDSAYTLIQTAPLKAPPKWGDVIEIGEKTITLREPALLDFGALGKGYLIDIVAQVLREEGIATFSIDAGGDIIQEDVNGISLRVGLEKPDNDGEVIGVIDLLNQSICGSAGNRRAWGKFHHIMDPRTLSSPRHIKALWVTAKTTLLADGISTALFFVEPEVLKGKYDFEYMILLPDNSFKKSEGFKGEIFTK